MLTIVQRIRLYALVIAGAVVLVGFSFNLQARSRLNDIRLVSEARALSYGLERYYHDYLRYPVASGVDLKKEQVLTENGFAKGNTVYYMGSFKSWRAVTYTGTEENYTIAFRLSGTWPAHGLEGTRCTVTKGYVLSCPDR